MCLCVLKPWQDSQEARNLSTQVLSLVRQECPGSELRFLCEFPELVGSAQEILSIQLFSFDRAHSGVGVLGLQCSCSPLHEALAV